MTKARNLVKRYGFTMAVSGLSFSIRPGLVTDFLGPNGAGKTTTMRMIPADLGVPITCLPSGLGQDTYQDFAVAFSGWPRR